MLRNMNKAKQGRLLSGGALKWLAVLLMLIDHLGASLLEVFVLNGYGNSLISLSTQQAIFWWRADRILRYVGRSAFPIFCFLLVEGAVHTKNTKKYLGRLFAFALLSEIPFDLALRNSIPWWNHQNVFFTLTLGLLVIFVFQRSAGREWRGFLTLAIAAVLAECCQTDYGSAGILVMAAMYLLREKRGFALAAAYLLLAISGRIELYSLPGFLLLFFYNGERGRQPKRFFYWFYPAHLLVLWAVGNFILPYMFGKI